MERLKEYLLKLLEVTYFFSLPDYLVFIGLFLVILLIFLLGVALRAHTFVFTFLFLLSGGLIFAAPFIYQWIMESYFKKTEFILTHNARLQYDAVYFVEGSFKNVGYLDFRGCVVEVGFIPDTLKTFAQMRQRINPKYSHVEIYKTPLNKGETMDFKLVIPSPNPQLHFQLHTKGACY